MAGTIKISTDQVEAIATSIENNNKKLKSTLEDSQSAVKSLSSTWQGEAAQVRFLHMIHLQPTIFKHIMI